MKKAALGTLALLVLAVSPALAGSATANGSVSANIANVCTISTVQLAAYRWSQGTGGETELEPTDDVVLFPRLLTLEPRKERRIRVGAVVAFAAREETDRIFVEELPSAESASLFSGIPPLGGLCRRAFTALQVAPLVLSLRFFGVV